MLFACRDATRIHRGMRMSCPLCDDTGWKPVDGGVTRRVVRCECWRENLGLQRLSEANIPTRYKHCTLANFEAYNESLERAVAKARHLAGGFPAVSQGLFLEGHDGVPNWSVMANSIVTRAL